MGEYWRNCGKSFSFLSLNLCLGLSSYPFPVNHVTFYIPCPLTLASQFDITNIIFQLFMILGISCLFKYTIKIFGGLKYRKKMGFSDFKMMDKLGFKEGIMISREKLERRNGFYIIPIELFLITRNN